MEFSFRIDDTHSIYSPGFVVFYEPLVANLHEMLRIAGDVKRLRPHCKTHKIREIAEMQGAAGIDKFKCATFAEAEMLARAGATDIFLAYNLVGPNIERAVQYVTQYPDVSLLVTADHRSPLEQLSAAMGSAGREIGVLLDLDSGMHRTGRPADDEALQLYGQVVDLPGVTPAGLHLYDGQNHQTDLDQRRSAVLDGWQVATEFRNQLTGRGWPVPRIVAGGTGSFPIFAELDDAGLELSPGTPVFFDSGYAARFPDLNFVPAARILTRVISCPTSSHICLDLGTKACASDPPMGSRMVIPDLPEARQVIHNEEHLVLETELAERYSPGDELLVIPCHVCPTTALYQHVHVIREGQLWTTWNVVARDRVLSV
jgi:D-serine deaminase-like pyridoxal phosphate-dependent protein